MARHNRLWFTCPPAFWRTVVRISFGTLIRLSNSQVAVRPCSSGKFSSAEFSFSTYDA
jgi:hypothetical protein